jgi:type VI secretion system secreted protein VgrG
VKAAFQLTVEGAPTLGVRAFEAFERSHGDAWVRVLARATAADHLHVDDLLGKKATLEISPKEASRGEARVFHGIVDAIELSVEGAMFTIVPRLIPLGDGCDHRVFLEKDSVAIAESLLKEANLKLDIRVGKKPKSRLQCVQAFESPLGFIRRILAEDGISLWVEHTDAEDVVVLGDDVSACHDLPGGPLSIQHGGGLVGVEAVTDVFVTHRLTHDGAAVCDYDPDKPAVDQSASVGGNRLQRFVYPGHHTSPDDGKVRAQLFLDEAQTEGIELHARSTCRHVAVGRVIELADGHRDDHNGRFRVVQVHHRGGDFNASNPGELRYEAELIAVPVARPVRPKREAASGIGGLQTMTVMGPSGKEIHTDKHGRVKARFRWDRISPKDDSASTWVRPMQPALSGGFMLPRTGWEVLVGFMSDPVPTGDAPIELGRLDNGQAPPAHSLPAKKVKSHFGSQSTPSSGKSSHVGVDDSAGSEGLSVNSAKDHHEKTENDKVVTVGASEKNTVGGNHTNSVTLQQITEVAGAQSYSVGGNRDVTTTGVLGISAASENVSVGGVRKFTVGGDYETKAASIKRFVGGAEIVTAIQGTNRHVTGAMSVGIGAAWVEIGGVSASVGVLGASTLNVGGPISIKAPKVSINASVLNETYAGLYKGHAGAKFTVGSPLIKLKAGAAFSAKGADVLFKAKSQIVIKAGGVTIEIKPSSIKVKGKIKGDSTSVVSTKEEVT